MANISSESIPDLLVDKIIQTVTNQDKKSKLLLRRTYCVLYLTNIKSQENLLYDITFNKILLLLIFFQKYKIVPMLHTYTPFGKITLYIIFLNQ